MIRHYTFRFLNREANTMRSIRLSSSHEEDARTAAWGLLGTVDADARLTWRMTSVVIAPVLDLAGMWEE